MKDKRQRRGWIFGVARSAIAKKTITDFERGATHPHPKTHARLIAAFETEGIEFTNGEGPGVRLKKIWLTALLRLQQQRLAPISEQSPLQG